jgi:hypothetical protein
VEERKEGEGRKGERITCRKLVRKMTAECLKSGGSR